MPVLKMKRIYRDDLQANPDALFLFGDNDKRIGYGGQAGEMRGEDNAVGVRTKWAPASAPRTAFFDDEDYDMLCGMIDNDLEPAIAALEDGKIVVIPLDGLGTGLSKLPELAPRVFEYLSEKLTALEDI